MLCVGVACCSCCYRSFLYDVDVLPSAVCWCWLSLLFVAVCSRR